MWKKTCSSNTLIHYSSYWPSLPLLKLHSFILNITPSYLTIIHLRSFVKDYRLMKKVRIEISHWHSLYYIPLLALNVLYWDIKLSLILMDSPASGVIKVALHSSFCANLYPGFWLFSIKENKDSIRNHHADFGDNWTNGWGGSVTQLKHEW